MRWDTSCKDWQRRIVAGESLITFPPLFPDAAGAGLSVFKDLHLKDVPGCPTYGQVGRKWQFDFVCSIFGAYDPKGMRRLIREFFLLVAKKNDKSGGAAGIMMTALILNDRESAEFIIIAPTVEIANNSFFPARDMVRTDEGLADLMLVQEHYRQITHRNTGATLKVVAADSDTVGGIKGTGILVEELWLFGKRPGALNMLREATGGLTARPEGFVIYLTTQSDEAPAGVFADKLEYARGVRDGKIDDPAFLPVLYEFPADMIKEKQHLEPKNFYIPNPNLGASVDEAFLVREFHKAEIEGQASMQSFLSKHLNIQIATSAKAQNWAGADFWDGAAGKVTLETILERSEVVVVGVDPGGLDDLIGFAALGRDREDPKKFLLWNKAWANRIAMERRKSEITKYREFEKDGDLIFTDTMEEAYRQVVEMALKIEDAGLLFKIASDSRGDNRRLIDECRRQGIEQGEKDKPERIVGVDQGWRLFSAIHDLEGMLSDGAITHSGSRIMQWCAGNARVEPKGNAIAITKQESGKGKIDPLIATFCAVALMAMNPEAKSTKSAYDGLTKAEMIARMTGKEVQKEGNGSND